MLFEIYIYEHWIDNPGNEADSIKTIHLFDDLEDSRDSYAFGLFCELVKEKDGLWKKKKFVETDGCWGEVIVKKDDLLYFIDEVNNRMMEEKDVLDDRSGRDKVMEIDDNRNYRLVAIES